jgi:hypothetical protein
MSALSSALVIPDSLLAKEATDIGSHRGTLPALSDHDRIVATGPEIYNHRDG